MVLSRKSGKVPEQDQVQVLLALGGHDRVQALALLVPQVQEGQVGGGGGANLQAWLVRVLLGGLSRCHMGIIKGRGD